MFAEYGFFNTQVGPESSGSADGLEYFRRIKDKGPSILYVPDVIAYHCLGDREITRESMLQRYRRVGYSLILAGVDRRNSIARIVWLECKIMVRYFKSLVFALTGNQSRKFKQQKKIAFYQGKIKGINSLVRSGVSSDGSQT